MKKITEKYFLDTDRYNWILLEKYHSKKYNKYTYKTIGYFSNLGTLGKALLELEAKVTMLDIDKIEKLKEEIDNTFHSYVKGVEYL